jgi:hypothetical protein
MKYYLIDGHNGSWNTLNELVHHVAMYSCNRKDIESFNGCAVTRVINGEVEDTWSREITIKQRSNSTYKITLTK